MFKIQTVVQTDSDTSIIVNRRYFPSRGMANEVGGIISASNKKNTVSDTRIEIHSVTWNKKKQLTDSMYRWIGFIKI